MLGATMTGLAAARHIAPGARDLTAPRRAASRVASSRATTLARNTLNSIFNADITSSTLSIADACSLDSASTAAVCLSTTVRTFFIRDSIASISVDT